MGAGLTSELQAIGLRRSDGIYPRNGWSNPSWRRGVSFRTPPLLLLLFLVQRFPGQVRHQAVQGVQDVPQFAMELLGGPSPVLLHRFQAMTQLIEPLHRDLELLLAHGSLSRTGCKLPEKAVLLWWTNIAPLFSRRNGHPSTDHD